MSHAAQKQYNSTCVVKSLSLSLSLSLWNAAVGFAEAYEYKNLALIHNASLHTYM
jgi:hypothetical protein